MAGDEVKVDPDDLRAKAAQIEALYLDPEPDAVQGPTVPADGLSSSRTAVDNLNQNAQALNEYEIYGRQQGKRLAETLRLVADAYATVDQNAMENINKTIPGETPAAPAPVTPGTNALPEPSLPQPLPIPRGPVTDEYLDVPTAQGQLLGPDQSASLQAAAAKWSEHGAALAAEAEDFEIARVNWEGEAADAAYRKFTEYRSFLLELSGAWARLATEAAGIAAAHTAALDQHTPIAEQYASLRAQLPAAIASGGSAARVIQLQMEELQKQSEELRHHYAREAQPRDVNPPEPPTNTGTPPTPVRSNGDPRQPAGLSQGQGGGSSGGGQQATEASEAPKTTPQDALVSPMSAADQAGPGASPGGGSPAGGSPGGGRGGSQTGSPGGGAPGGAPSGIPALGKGDLRLPNDSSLRPAASGAGGGGSGGGGGMPSSPLQPAVGAETVAPTPISTSGATAPSGGAGGGGATGGAMGGGMAPMMGAGRGGGNGDKKRNPQLSEDEELYTEDRPWTEAVIGNRARRRVVSDDSKKESQ